MRFEQTRDVLEHARDFHHRVSEFYRHLADRAEQKRVKLLLDYMSRHEENLEQALEEYSESASRQILDEWFGFTHDTDTLRLCEETQFHPDMSVEDVVAAGLKIDECLVSLYREMAENAETEEVRDVFRNLLDLEEREKHKLARNALRAMDM